MGNEKGSQFQQGTFNWGAEVKPQGPGARAELPIARPASERPMFGETVMEAICERSNMQAALRQVRANKGSPGVDHMSRGRTAWLSAGALAGDQRTLVERGVRTAARQTGGDPQAGEPRETQVRHSLCA